MDDGAEAAPQGADVELEVFDLLGRRVATLARGSYPAGTHEFRWIRRATAGMYFARLRTLGETRTLRFVVAR